MFKSFIRRSETGIFEAIFDESRKIHKISRCLHCHNSIGLVVTLQRHIIYKYFIYLFSIAINKMLQWAIFIAKNALQCTHKCSRFSSCVAILCVYDERRARCKSRDISPDIPMWLKNGVSSHSYIGHWQHEWKFRCFQLTRWNIFCIY